MSESRLKAMIRNCRNRGGECPCGWTCQAVDEIDAALLDLEIERHKIESRIKQLEDCRRRLTAPPATLREGFTFLPGLQPVVVFDGGEATFGYENSDGEWIESNSWPFSQESVWYDDCERHGIRVE